MARRPRPTPRRGTRAGLLVVLAGVLALVGVVPAWAHGGPGEVVLAGVLTGDGTTLHLEATITYVNDGEPAERATVSVTGTDATGARSAPVELVAGDAVGTYEADLRVPEAGVWGYAVQSTFPPATAAFVVTVDATGAVDVGLPAPVDPGGGDDGRGIPSWAGAGIAAGVAALGLAWVGRRLLGSGAVRGAGGSRHPEG